MKTKEVLGRVRRNQEKKQLQQDLIKFKKYISRLFLTPTLKRNFDTGDFYIVDGNGFRVLQEEYKMDCSKVFDTWEKTYDLLKTKDIIDRNNRKFSDERILKSRIKELNK